MKKIVFLYTELADYFINCLNELVNEKVNVLLIHWTVNKEAPFKLELNDAIIPINKNELSDTSLIKTIDEFNADVIVCSGWLDKSYLKVCRKNKNKVPTVLAMDTQWEGSLKQQLGSKIYGFYLKNHFSHVWVPGEKQRIFARKLGFEDSKISQGFYVANRKNFLKFSSQIKNQKRFLYIGRYVKHKGIYELWEAFTELYNEGYSEWELWCAGTGEEWEKRIIHKKIKHFGFVQPNEMVELLNGTSIYILPSHKEPWGVSVHEMAISGFPMILSDKVGASESFLKDGINGFLFHPKIKNDLKSKMKKMMTLKNDQIANMGKSSFELSNSVTSEQWIKTLLSFSL